MEPEVTVDPELCIGSGDCVRLLPAAFRIDESLGVSVPQPGAAMQDRRLLLRARSNCPTHAIEMTDTNGEPVPDIEEKQ
jgi:ferredoxin